MLNKHRYKAKLFLNFSYSDEKFLAGKESENSESKFLKRNFTSEVAISGKHFAQKSVIDIPR